MTRRAKIVLAILGALVVLGGAFVWALPEIVRRTLVTQIPKLTGRSAAIEDIDLNLFTGRLVLKKFRLAEREPSQTFLEVDRVDLRVSPLGLVSGNLRLGDLTVTAPTIRIVRTGPVEFNFSDLLALLPRADPNKPRSRWTVSIGRLALANGAILVSDRAVTPAREWRVQGITIEAGGLTTSAARQPGHLDVRARVNEAPFDMTAGSVQLTPTALSAHLALDRFDLTQLGPYLPPGLPASLESGTLALALDMAVERGEEGLTRAMVSGDVRVEGLALAQPGRSTPFARLPRLTVAVKEADLISRSATLSSIEADGVDLRAVRDRAGNVDLLALGKPSDAGAARAQGMPAPSPASSPASGPRPDTPAAVPFKLKLERLTLRSGTVGVSDQAVSPAREWRIEGLAVDGSGLSNSGEDPPGTLRVQARLSAQPAGKPAAVVVEADSLRLVPLAASVKLSLTGFDVTSVVPYVPDTVPATPASGTLGVNLRASVEQGQKGLSRATASGSVRLADLKVVRRGATMPFLALARLGVGIKQADAVSRSVSLGTVDLEGWDLRVVRDPEGKIDLLALLAAAPPGAAGAPRAGPTRPVPGPPKPSGTASPAWRISLDRFALSKSRGTFEDQSMTPAATLALTDLTVTAASITWPPTSQSTFTASLTMPGGGRTEVKGTAKLEPLDVQIRLSTRDAPIEPYQVYFPFAARFLGFFSGDSVSEIQRGADGKLVLASRGAAWARDLEIRAPGAETAVARMPQFEIRGIDFSWPNYALVEQVKFVRPEAQIERNAEGNINVRDLFAVRSGGAPAVPTPAPASQGQAGKPGAPVTTGDQPASGGEAEAGRAGGLLQTMVLDFTQITIEDGSLRFLDRTTTPAFSEDVSRLTLNIRDLSNVLGRQRTTMTAEAIVGGDAALDMRGELSGIGETLRADLVGELRDFTLPSANPYADTLTSWIVERGKLTAKIHYRIEGDHLIAAHDVKFGGLKVQRARESDEAKRRIGLPLGLVVALLKDSRGDIDFSLPLSGTLSDRKFDWGESMWAAAKQAILKILAAPFNAIGRLFTGGGDKVEALDVNPVTFAPGSSVIGAPMEIQLTRVADFLRRSPYVRLTLAPVTTTADLESLKLLEVTRRLEQFQREQGLHELAAALRAYYQQHVPDVTLPKTMDDQLSLLVKREPVPAAPLADLAKRRLEATRDRLVKVEGIPTERLATSGAPPPSAASGEGRVEFTIGEGE